MTKVRFDTRHVVLVVLFVMIFICSMMSVSYAFFTSTAVNKNDLIISQTNMACLNITPTPTTTASGYGISSSLPAYLIPLTDYDATHTAAHGMVQSWTTNEAFGMIMYQIQNNCSEAVKIDMVFVPTQENQFDLGEVKYAYCNGSVYGDGSVTSCSSGSYYAAVRTLGNASTCYGTSNVYGLGQQSSVWDYIARYGYPNAPLGGVDERICSVLKQDFSNYMSIPANGTKVFTIRYWLSDNAHIHWNKRFAGYWLVYTRQV